MNYGKGKIEIDVKAISIKEVNFLNVVFCLVAVMAIIYTSYIATLTNKQADPTIMPEHKIAINLSKITNNYPTDLTLINKALKQQNIDISIAYKTIRASSYQLIPSRGLKYNLPLINYQLKRLNFIFLENSLLANISRQQKNAYQQEIDNLIMLLNKIKGQITINKTNFAITNQINSSFVSLVTRIEYLKVADDEQIVDRELSQLASQTETSISKAEIQGINPTNLYADLTTTKSDLYYGLVLAKRVENQLLSSNSSLSQQKLVDIKLKLTSASSDLSAALNALKVIVYDLAT